MQMINTKTNISTNTDKKITQLIKDFNSTIKECEDSKSNHRSISIDFYLKNRKYSH